MEALLSSKLSYILYCCGILHDHIPNVIYKALFYKYVIVCVTIIIRNQCISKDETVICYLKQTLKCIRSW